MEDTATLLENQDRKDKTLTKKKYAKLSKLDATCNTFLSLLFVILLVIFSLFIMDMMGVLNLTQLTKMVQDKQTENPILKEALNELDQFIQIDDSEIAEMADQVYLQITEQHLEQVEENDQKDQVHLDNDSQQFVDNVLVGNSQSDQSKTQSDNSNLDQLEYQENKIREDIKQEFDAVNSLSDDLALVEKGTNRKYRRIDQEVIDRQAAENGKFKMMELSNHMKILLIQYDTVEKSSASLTVEAGHWHDPAQFEGLARLCELMVFGQADVEIYGDVDNTHTSFFFESESDKFMNVLNDFGNRLSKQNIFNEDDMKSKIDQVDQMFKTQDWKLGNLYSLLADKNHPVSKFQGNVRSLRKKGVFQALNKFYSTRYSANLMSLTIRTDKNIDQLEAWIVRESDFAMIKNKNTKRQEFEFIGKPLLENSGSVVKLKDNNQEYDIILDYQLPGKQKYIRTKPLEFIDYFMRINEKGSLKEYLIDEQGLVDRVDTQLEFIEGKGFSNYLIKFKLNKDNKKQFDQKQLGYRLSKIVNNYLMYLRDNSEKQEQYYNEQKELSYGRFMSSGKTSLNRISQNILKYDSRHILSDDYVLEQYKQEPINLFMNEMMNADNLIIYVLDQGQQEQLEQALLEINKKGSSQDDLDFIKQNNLQYTRNSKVYDIQYAIKKLSQQTKQFIMEQDQSIQKHFKLPPFNKYIPDSLSLFSLCTTEDGSSYILENIDIKKQTKSKGQSIYIQEQDSYETRLNMFLNTEKKDLHTLTYNSMEECIESEIKLEKSTEYPQLIQKQKNSQIWWKLDRSYQLPTAYVALEIDINNKEIPTAKSQIMLELYTNYLSQLYSHTLDSAIQSGYSLTFQSQRNSISLSIYGFSSKIKTLFSDIVNCPCLFPKQSKQSSFLETETELDNKYFQNAKQTLYSQLKSTYDQPLYQQLNSLYLPLALQKPFYQPAQLLDQLNSISKADLSKFHNNIIQSYQYTTLFLGNIQQQDALEMSSSLDSTNIPHQSNPKYQIINLRKNDEIIYTLTANKLTEQSATLNYYQIGQRTEKSYAAMKFLESFVLTKISKQKNIIAAYFKPMACVDGVAILAENDKKSSQELNQDIEDYITKLGNELQNISKKQLQSTKQAAIHKLNQQEAKTLQQEGDFYWKHIDDLAFEENEIAGSIIKALTKHDIMTFYNQVFLATNRGKLSMQLYGSEDKLKQAKYDNPDVVVNNAELFSDRISSAYTCDYELE